MTIIDRHKPPATASLSSKTKDVMRACLSLLAKVRPDGPAPKMQ